MGISWKALLNEMLWRIFTAVEKTSDLVQLQQVYQTPLLLPYVQTLEHSTYQPRFLVMAIDLSKYFPAHRYAQPEKYKMFVHAIARLCPHIARIMAGAKAPSKSFYRDLLDLHWQGYFQQLQYLPNFNHTKAYESELDYYRLAVVIKASLTRVSIAKNPSSKLFGDDQPEMNMWEHLKAFPRLKQLDVSYSGKGFLYEADDFIAKCIAPVVNIHICLTGFSNGLLWPLVDLDAVKPKPQVKHLSVDIFRLTAQDLEYLICKFAGLASLSMKNTQDHRSTSLLIQSQNGDADILHACFKFFFRYLVSLKRFKVSKLWCSPFDMELFTFWAEHPQLKAMAISKCSMFESAAHFMTVLTRDRETGYKLIDDQDIKDGVYELELALKYFNFSIHCSQVLELFRRSTIKTLHLRDIASTSPEHTEGRERRTSVGDSLGYIIDHYTAIKDIQLYQANCRTFDALPAEKQLQKLTVKQCCAYPNVLLQLSRSVEYIEKLILHEIAMANADSHDRSFVINMPQTAIGNMRVINYSARIYLVDLFVSEPSSITRYLQIQADDVVYMVQDAYNAKCLANKYHNDCIVVHINCKKLKMFGTSYGRYHSLISEQ